MKNECSSDCLLLSVSISPKDLETTGPFTIIVLSIIYNNRFLYSIPNKIDQALAATSFRRSDVT